MYASEDHTYTVKVGNLSMVLVVFALVVGSIR